MKISYKTYVPPQIEEESWALIGTRINPSWRTRSLGVEAVEKKESYKLSWKISSVEKNASAGRRCINCALKYAFRVTPGTFNVRGKRACTNGEWYMRGHNFIISIQRNHPSASLPPVNICILFARVNTMHVGDIRDANDFWFCHSALPAISRSVVDHTNERNIEAACRVQNWAYIA